MRLLPKDQGFGWTPYAWLVYLAFLFIQPVVLQDVREWALALGVTSVFLVLYFIGFWVDGKRMMWIVAAITLLAAAYFPHNVGAGCLFIYACSFAAWIGTTRQAVIAIAIIESITLAECIAFGVRPMNAFWPLMFNVLIGALNIHAAERDRANAKLQLAHDEVEHLAKVAERERIARDLHDLLGHTLSLIILKSELASKLAERDVERARQEIRDVERISREALAQVRSAVRGYRSGGLEAELTAAKEALTAANVTVTFNVEPLALTPQHEAVIALALREAITNIVRHAQARHCNVTLAAPCTLTIEDDGRGGEQSFGSGLLGMRERVESLGGTFVRDGTRGTRITITLPVETAATTAHAERSA